MANEDYLEILKQQGVKVWNQLNQLNQWQLSTILKQGVKVWNQWRRKNPEVKLDLKGADLSGANLSGANLSSTDLSGANLSGANLSSTDLKGADLKGANLKGADLKGADLKGANLKGANLSSVDLRRANLSSVDLKGAELSGANLKGLLLIGVDLRRANLSEANLRRANLSEANLGSADLSQANLSQANLSKADFSKADFSEDGFEKFIDSVLSGVRNGGQTTLTNVDLSGTNLKWANLTNVDLSDANLSGADLSQANLSGTNLKWANLSNVDLSEANLRGANLGGADLNGQNLSNVDLSEANLRGTNLSGADLNGQNLSNVDLSEANLRGTNLSRADLNGQNLSNFDLSKANLSGANLSKTQALGTNFTAAIFTGACIEDWHTNSATNLKNVICDYVYLWEGQQERRPSDINKNFAPEEFTKLFQKAQETVDLIFRDGIDWKAFLASFHKLQVECGDEELSIQAIENKSDGAFVIRVNVPRNANKAEIEKYLKREYELTLTAVEEKYRSQLQAEKDQIAIYREKSADLMEMARLMANRPIQNIINVTNNAESKSVSESYQSKYDQRNSNNQFVDTAQPASNPTFNQNNYIPEQKQNLAEAAKEIQQLLYQLSQANSTTNEEVTEAILQEIKRNPTLKVRLQSALKAGGLEALKAIFNHPLFNIPAETIKGWLEAE